MVQAEGSLHDVSIRIPISKIEEIIIQEHNASHSTQTFSADGDAYTSMIISFHPNDSSWLLINGKEFAVSVLQLYLKEGSDATELRDRIDGCQKMASQGRMSVSQLIDISQASSLSIPDFLAEPGTDQVLESHPSNPTLYLQNETEDANGIQRVANSVLPDGDHESASLIKDCPEALPAASVTDASDCQPPKPSSANKQAPMQKIVLRRSPRIHISVIESEVPMSHNHSPALADLKKLGKLPKGALHAIAPNKSDSPIAPSEMPIVTNEAGLKSQTKVDAVVGSGDKVNPFHSLRQHVRRSPRLAGKGSRVSTKVNKINFSDVTSPSGLSQAKYVQLSIPHGKEWLVEHSSTPKKVYATVASEKTYRQKEEAQAVQSRKPANGRVTKAYSSKGGESHPSRPQGNEADSHDETDLWNIPSDEPLANFSKSTKITNSKNTAKPRSGPKPTKKKELEKTARTRLKKPRNSESKGQSVGKSGKKDVLVLSEAQSESLQEDDDNEYVPSQGLPQASHLPGPNASNDSMRVLRSSVRKANSQHEPSFIFHKLIHRGPIRKITKKSVFIADQKIARVGPEIPVAVEGNTLHNSNCAPLQEASATAEPVQVLELPSPIRGSEAIVPPGKSKDLKLPQVIAHFPFSRVDDVNINNYDTKVSRLRASGNENYPQELAILVTCNEGSTCSGNQLVQGSSEPFSGKGVPNNEPSSNSVEPAGEDRSPHSKPKQDLRSEVSLRNLSLQQRFLDNEVVDPLSYPKNPVVFAESASNNSNAHSVDFAAVFQEHFENATAFNDLGEWEHSARERTPTPVPANTMVEKEEYKIIEPGHQETNIASLHMEEDPKTPQRLTKDTFASKVATFLRNVESVRLDESSKPGNNTGQDTKSPTRPQKVTETAPSMPVSKDTRCRISELPLSSPKALPTQPIVAVATPANLQPDSDIRVLRSNGDVSQNSADMSMPPSQEMSILNLTSKAHDEIPMMSSQRQQQMSRELAPKDQLITQSDPCQVTKKSNFQRSLLESTSSEGSLSPEKNKTSIELLVSKRKASEKAEGDIKRLRMSPTEWAKYVTPRKKVAADGIQGGLTGSPLTNERDYLKPKLITFNSNGPRNQGMKTTSNNLKKPQIEHCSHLAVSQPPSSSKRKHYEEGNQQGQEDMQEDSRKRLKHIQFFLPSTSKQDSSLIDMSSANSLEHRKLQGSQSTRVTLEGSPIGTKQCSHDNDCIPLVPCMMSKIVRQIGEDVDEEPLAITEQPVSNLGSFYEHNMNFPNSMKQPLDNARRKRRVKSGYGKLLPSTPTAPSRMLTDLTAHTVEPDGRFYNIQTRHLLYETEIPDPFTNPKAPRPPTEKAQPLNANSFLERLRKSVTMTQKPAKPSDYAGEHATGGQDTDKALIGVEDQELGRVTRSPDSPGSSHSSSSASTRRRRRSPSKSDGPGDSPRTLDRKQWKAALKPHQADTRRILEEMSDVGSDLLFGPHVLIEFLSILCEIWLTRRSR